MKYIKLFDTTANMNAAIANTTVGFLGMAENNGNPVLRTVPTPTPTPSHDYVEIGGVKWATMNIGASTITDAGLYFQWGDTQGYTADELGYDEGKKLFSENDYLYYNEGEYTKYNLEDMLDTLEYSDDAVSDAKGANWRMPTAAEFQSLGQAVNAVWTENYNNSGVNGLVCTDKTDSSKVLFFPATGSGSGESIESVGYLGKYWSSSKIMDGDYVDSAWVLDFSEDTSSSWGDIVQQRYSGFTVRGVLDD